MARVLIVDDSDIIRVSLQKDLQDRQVDTLTAQDGHRALELIRDNPELELVIVDYNMPNMDGLTMIERARYELNRSQLKFVVLTTEDSRELKKRGRSLGVAGWVVKPTSDTFLDIIMSSVLGK